MGVFGEDVHLHGKWCLPRLPPCHARDISLKVRSDKKVQKSSEDVQVTVGYIQRLCRTRDWIGFRFGIPLKVITFPSVLNSGTKISSTMFCRRRTNLHRRETIIHFRGQKRVAVSVRAAMGSYERHDETTERCEKEARWTCGENAFDSWPKHSHILSYAVRLRNERYVQLPVRRERACMQTEHND